MDRAAIVRWLEEAFEHHRSGRWDEAERGYDRVLSEAPDLADALHLRGVLAHQRGESVAAIELIGRAIGAEPDAAPYHSNLGNALRAAGRLDDAVRSFERALALEPAFPDALGNLGSALLALGRLAEAGEHLERALELDPGSVPNLTNLGAVRRAQGRIAEAIELWRRALALRPDHADALANLGRALEDDGRVDEAIDVYRRAAALGPDPELTARLGAALARQGRAEEAREVLPVGRSGVETAVHCGIAFQELGDLEAAERSYRDAIALDPASARAWTGLATVLRLAGRAEESLEASTRALDAGDGSADAHDVRGLILQDRGAAEPALACYRRALEIDPVHRDAHSHLGDLLYALGRIDEAAAAYRAWISAEPDHPVPLHRLAACTGEAAPDRASDDFVRREFDHFAPAFDEKLRSLGYRVPEILAGALEARLGTPARDREVLDAGVGTGLCGPHLRPWARRLVGVDLSAEMLARARGRSLYDELIEAELVAYLEEEGGAFDLVVAADTLIYFGDLEGVLGAVAARLRSGGLLAFSLEELGEDERAGGARDRHLRPSGRYAHAESYVRSVLEASGLRDVRVERAVLRRELARPVEGLIMTSCKP